MHLSITGVLASKTRHSAVNLGRRNRALFSSTTLSKTTSTTATISVHDTVASPPPPSSKAVSDVLAGATARVASQATVHPLDTLKVRMQTTVRTAKTVKGIGKPLPALHRAAGNVLTLYKGVIGAAAGAGFGIGTYFVFYSAVKKMLTKRSKLNSGTIAFVSAGTAAATCSVIKTPLAVCVRSVQAGIYKNAFSAAMSIVKEVGVRGLFTGYLPTVVEDAPDMAVKFAAYETMRSVYKSVLTDRQPSAQEDFAMGAISGALAAACTTPIDVVKTNMMCEAVSRPSMVAVAKSVMRNKGPTGFFQGVGPRALSNGINSAVFFCFFEAFRSIIVKKQNQVKGPVHPYCEEHSE
eukprot:g632.t1